MFFSRIYQDYPRRGKLILELN